LSWIWNALRMTARYRPLAGRIASSDGGYLWRARAWHGCSRRASKLIENRVDKVVTGQPERQTPRCAHIDLCGGCSLPAPWRKLLKLKGPSSRRWPSNCSISPVGAGARDCQALLVRSSWLPPAHSPAVIALWTNRLGCAGMVGYRRSASSSDLVEVHECPVLVPALEALVQAWYTAFQVAGCIRTLACGIDCGRKAGAAVVRHIAPLSCQ